MTITTTQVSADEALRAVADGKSVQMIWTNDGKPFFSDFTAKIRDAMAIGEAFLIVDVTEDEPTDIEAADKVLSEAMVKTGVSVEDFNAMMKEHSKAITFETEGKIASSQENIADNCENAAEIHPEPKKKLDDGKIMALYKAGWSAAKIADEMNTTPQTVHAHLRKLREGGRL